MADYSRSRASANVVTAPADMLRRNWLETAAFAPDNYRAANGLSVGLSPDTRNAAMSALYDERPGYVDPSQDFFGVGRAPQLPVYAQGVEPLAPLGAASAPSQAFMQRNDSAMLSQDVARMLAQGAGEDPTSTAIQSAMTRLGYR